MTRTLSARLLFTSFVLVTVAGLQPISAAGPASVDLSTFVRVGRFDLPEPTRTAAPAGSLLAQEASGITYNWDTDTLFVVGDGGTSVVQVSKTGALIDSMTLAPGPSPASTDFYDTEGIAYVGGGKFVLIEERYRQVSPPHPDRPRRSSPRDSAAPAGALTLGPGGAFAFTAWLEARRLGSDRDGRQYQVIVTAADVVGNQASATVIVSVPHDQGE